MEAAIQLTGIRKRFGAVQSLDDLELTVARGAVFGFLGPNGAGKTTTLRVLLGLVRPDAGQVRVLGRDPLEEPLAVRGEVGVLLEHDGLYERLSAVDNLEFHGRLHRMAPSLRRARIEELLRGFQLWERRSEPVVRWSKGMRQKLAVARALMPRPRLILLDEPFTGLDPAAAAELRQEIVRLGREEQVTVVLTTHDLAHVEKAATEVALIRSGRVIAHGSPSELTAGRSEIEVEVRGAGLTGELCAALQRDGLVLRFELAGENAARLACAPGCRRRLGVELVQRGVELEELHTARASLEEAFLSLVQGKETGS